MGVKINFDLVLWYSNGNIGMDNNKNKIPIIISCHWVIGSNGKLAGYSGGIKVKEDLLRA